VRCACRSSRIFSRPRARRHLPSGNQCRDAEFPSADFRALGYNHVEINGQKGYHGVAIASKLPLRLIDKLDFAMRAMRVTSPWSWTQAARR